MARRFGMTHFVNPTRSGATWSPQLVELTGGGADYSFECIGNVGMMRQALECCHRGWGVSVIIGVAGAGPGIATRPFQLVTGRVWKGSAFGGARGRSDVPRLVDWYMDKKMEIDSLITHKLPLDRSTQGFDLMHAGESMPRRSSRSLRLSRRALHPSRLRRDAFSIASPSVPRLAISSCRTR